MFLRASERIIEFHPSSAFRAKGLIRIIGRRLTRHRTITVVLSQPGKTKPCDHSLIEKKSVQPFQFINFPEEISREFQPNIKAGNEFLPPWHA